MHTIAELTLPELELIITRIVDTRLNQQVTDSYRLGEGSAHVLNALRQQIIRATPGVPSPTEMLREERDQWYKPTS